MLRKAQQGRQTCMGEVLGMHGDAHVIALPSFVLLLLGGLLVFCFIDILCCGGLRLPAALSALLPRHDDGTPPLASRRIWFRRRRKGREQIRKFKCARCGFAAGDALTTLQLR